MGTTDFDIVKQCSAGAILHGIYYGIDREVFSVSRRHLIEMPNELNLLSPKLPKIEGTIKLNSKQELDAFEQSIIKTEISFDSGLKFKGLNAHRGGRHMICDPKQKSETKFFSEVSYTMFPSKMLDVGSDQLMLSNDAINALVNIHKQVDGKWKNGNDKRRHLYHLCTEFFKNFGSHFNCGLIHLGGILTTTSTYEGDTELSDDTIEKLVSASLKANESAGLVETGIKKSAKWLKDKGNIIEKIEEADVENLHISHQQYGGSPSIKAPTKDEWMTKLCNESTAWVIIDRRVPGKDNCVGVWDLLDLLPADKFDGQSNRLRLHNILFEIFSTFLYRNDIYGIMATGIDPKSILNALRGMRAKTEKRVKTNGVTKEWLHLLLDDRNVAKFLLKIERYLQELDVRKLDEIEEIMTQLLDYVKGNDFENKRKVDELKENIKIMSLRRKDVRNFLAKKNDPGQTVEQYLEELFRKASSLSTVEWVQILNEDATVPDYLFDTLTGADGKRAKIKYLVNNLVDIAGEEIFPRKDDIDTKLDARP